MKNILIRNLSEETVKRLKEKAAANGRSLHAEIKFMLDGYASEYTREEAINKVNEIYEAFKKEKRTFSDSDEGIRSLRD